MRFFFCCDSVVNLIQLHILWLVNVISPHLAFKIEWFVCIICCNYLLYLFQFAESFFVQYFFIYFMYKEESNYHSLFVVYNDKIFFNNLKFELLSLTWIFITVPVKKYCLLIGHQLHTNLNLVIGLLHDNFCRQNSYYLISVFLKIFAFISGLMLLIFVLFISLLDRFE